jgi:hypothetical protein
MGKYLIISIRLPSFNFLNKDSIDTNFMESEGVKDKAAPVHTS